MISKKDERSEEMTQNKKRWMYTPKKKSVKVPKSTKVDVDRRCNELIDSFLKPAFIKSPPEDSRFNYLVDILSKWYRNYFDFCSRYYCPGPTAISPFFDDKFARLEYIGNDSLNLAYMRYTGKWQELYSNQTLEECLIAVQNEVHFYP